jgi:hypothetical protein
VHPLYNKSSFKGPLSHSSFFSKTPFPQNGIIEPLLVEKNPVSSFVVEEELDDVELDDVEFGVSDVETSSEVNVRVIVLSPVEDDDS